MNKDAMGKVIFKNGHEEPIVFYRKFDRDHIIFYTESAMYKYYQYIRQERAGMLYMTHEFVQYLYYSDRWVTEFDIERIELKED